MTSPVTARVAVVLMTLLAELSVALDLGPPLQALAQALFLVLAPGVALLAAAPWPRLVWLVGVLATSLSVDVLLSTALLYLGWWSPDVVLACLVLLCLGAVGPQLVRSVWMWAS